MLVGAFAVVIQSALFYLVQCNSTTDSPDGNDLTSLIVIISFVSVIALIGLAILLYCYFVRSPPPPKVKDKKSTKSVGVSVNKSPKEEHDEQKEDDQMFDADQGLDKSDNPQGGSSSNIRGNTPTKLKKIKKNKKPFTGSSPVSKQSYKSGSSYYSKQTKQRLSSGKKKNLSSQKQFKTKINYNSKMSSKVSRLSKRIGGPKKKDSGGRWGKVQKVSNSKRRPQSLRPKGSVQKGASREQSKDQNFASETKVYGEGVDFYKNILKSLRSVKSVSQYFGKP